MAGAVFEISVLIQGVTRPGFRIAHDDGLMVAGVLRADPAWPPGQGPRRVRPGRRADQQRGRAGAVRSWVLSRIDGERAEVVALSFWESRDAIASFAGPDIEESVLYPEDERYLLGTPSIRHYDVSE